MKIYSFIALLILVFSCTRKEDKTTSQASDFCSNIHRNDSLSLSDQLSGISDYMHTKTGVYVLEDGAGSMVTRAWLSEYAEKSIDIQYFIFSIDNVGLIACDYLVRAADRGVKVRILVDDIMVDVGIEEILTLDLHKNIEIKIYNPGVNLGKNIYSKIKKIATDFRSANQRMHNKTFIVDGKVVITGGRNIADEYFDYDHEFNFRDRDVLLLGKVTEKVDHSFQDFWNSSLSIPITELSSHSTEINDTEETFAKLHEYACNPENFWPQVRTRLENLPTVFENFMKQAK